MLKAWHEHDGIEFRFVNSHEKVSAVRDTSAKETLRRSLKTRLDNSKNMVLIIGEATRLDTDWVPYEIAYATDVCGIPIIAAYTQYDKIMNPSALGNLWPSALATRIATNRARVIHIPFKKNAINDAISRFTISNPPSSALDYYTFEAHRNFGIL